MRLTLRFAPAAIVALLLALPAGAGRTKPVEASPHDAYVAAINSNVVETLLADLTDDIV